MKKEHSEMRSLLVTMTVPMMLTTFLNAAVAGEAAKPEQPKAVIFPHRNIPAPEARGKGYRVPAPLDDKNPLAVVLGWTCELPDGTGLAFGGAHQKADDGNPHTSIMEKGAWKPIIEELRKNNPLQERFTQIRALRDTCKDTLAKARNIFFEGRTAAEEGKLIKTDVDPAVDKLLKDLAALMAELKGVTGPGAYEAGQVKYALTHLEAAAGHIKPFGALTTPGQLAAMRKGQIELEIAGEALDCEPPPRALSKTTYEPKTKLFVIFGGEHFDYSLNDLWVFDPKKNKWFQRHPETAPEPRADHHMEATGDGKIVMFGGYLLTAGYTHVGPARWIYDVEKNVWSADGHQEKTYPSDSRAINNWPPPPEAYMGGARPDAAANEAKLKALPVNTWVSMTPIPFSGRDWGTWGVDFERDLFYVWAGGHGSYPGNDVARYHLGSGRWEITEVPTMPLGGIGTCWDYPVGVDFNKRPWVKCHTWNSHAYDTKLRKMVQIGYGPWDNNFYLYDPDKADWTSRHPLVGISVNLMKSNLRDTKHGMLCWQWTSVALLDAKSLEWKLMALKGNMPLSDVDSSALVYDPKRDRMLFLTTGYEQPYDGQIHALDFATSKVTALNPEGMDNTKSLNKQLREIGYHPDSDLFIIPEQFKKNNTTYPGLFPAYDATKNRWVLIKLAVGPGVGFGLLHSFMAYDAKRGLFWSGSSGGGGGVYVLRFDAGKAEITPMKDFVPPAAEKK